MAELEKEIREALTINDADLQNELREHSVKQFYYGSMWARSLRAERAQKLAVETLEAELCQQFRKMMAEERPTERVTEKMLKEYINNHPEYKAAQEKLIQLGLVSDLFAVAKDAFESRARLLLELAKFDASNKFYENEVRNMQAEFERREEEKARKREKKSKQDEINNQ